ncbi:MAG: PDDEXK nuclease domain-containing protein [Bacteroides sp.]|nr:PDDEXK nuclease domain-containing protein [Bacteroides sp.]
MKETNEEKEHLPEKFIQEIKNIILTARTNAVRSVDFCRVQMYWQMGQRIFEEEQQGKERADYGIYLIRNLAKEIQPEFGSGFGPRQLERSRQFYRLYPIASTLWTQLNWSQYKLLISIEDTDKREYYLHEAVNNCWAFRELERQVNSHLYERLLMSNDKESVLAVARQKRILLGDDEFFIDLVLYNRLLRCFVIIEIKTGKLTHQDLGQLQMYVNYYDRIVKLLEESPTVGILLCSQKNDVVVKMALPDNSNLHAAEYKLYLPEEKLLQTKVEEWTIEFNKK